MEDVVRLQTWKVTRTDDNGNISVMAQGMCETAARLMAENMAARGHKQLYVAEPDNTVDANAQN